MHNTSSSILSDPIMLLKLPIINYNNIIMLLGTKAYYAQNYTCILAIEIMLSGDVKFNRFKLHEGDFVDLSLINRYIEAICQSVLPSNFCTIR